MRKRGKYIFRKREKKIDRETVTFSENTIINKFYEIGFTYPQNLMAKYLTAFLFVQFFSNYVTITNCT